MASAAPNAIGAEHHDSASPGQDHPHYAWSPLPSRPPLRWPHEATAALTVVVDLSVMEWERPGRQVHVPPPGGRGAQPYPDFPRVSHREYGHRAGIFRLVKLLHDLGAPFGVAVDVATVEHYAPVISYLDEFRPEYLAHGLSASRPITSEMTDEEERHYVGMTLDRLEAALGSRPKGWLGAEYSESSRTPQILAASGLDYVCDWVNDEQPYPMTTDAGELWALPLSWDLADVNAMHLRMVAPDQYGRSLLDAADVLAGDGQGSGRLLGLHLHPWVVGQPFRISAFERAMAELLARDDWWAAAPGDAVAWCKSLTPRD